MQSENLDGNFANEKCQNPLAPLRVLEVVSTQSGYTTRLKTKQARQHQLASLSFLPTIRGISEFGKALSFKSRHSPNPDRASIRAQLGQKAHNRGTHPKECRDV